MAMLSAQNLREIHLDVQTSRKFEMIQVLAVLNHLIDIAERLEKVERVCGIQES